MDMVCCGPAKAMRMNANSTTVWLYVYCRHFDETRKLKEDRHFTFAVCVGKISLLTVFKWNFFKSGH